MKLDGFICEFKFYWKISSHHQYIKNTIISTPMYEIKFQCKVCDLRKQIINQFDIVAYQINKCENCSSPSMDLLQLRDEEGLLYGNQSYMPGFDISYESAEY